MKDKIRHNGIVESIDGQHIQVRIQQTSACATCSVAGRCNASESKEKLIDVFNVEDKDIKVGDEVNICAAGEVGMNAVILSFGLPFIVLIIFLFLAYTITNNELFSALIGLCSLIPYYIIIYLLRDKISKRFSFTIES
jgi:sigma-E factor negative regulatory protein RseC